MPYIRKTRDIFEIQASYGQGFECVNTETSCEEALRSLREYRDNDPNTSYILRKKREKIAN